MTIEKQFLDFAFWKIQKTQLYTSKAYHSSIYEVAHPRVQLKVVRLSPCLLSGLKLTVCNHWAPVTECSRQNIQHSLRMECSPLWMWRFLTADGAGCYILIVYPCVCWVLFFEFGFICLLIHELMCVCWPAANILGPIIKIKFVDIVGAISQTA